MNLAQRWCDLSVQDYIAVSQTWSWCVGALQVGLGAVVGLVFLKIKNKIKTKKINASEKKTSLTDGSPLCARCAGDLVRLMADPNLKIEKCEICTMPCIGRVAQFLP